MEAASSRLNEQQDGNPMPMDIIVVPEAEWMQLKDKPGMIYREAWREGKIVYES